MENDVKREAKKQYLKYFRTWFIVVAILMVLGLVVSVVRMIVPSEMPERTNYEAPIERVYDYADVLTDEEEQMLRLRIAELEPQIQADIVLVTAREVIETAEVSWETAMMNYADDFYDTNLFGYDMVHGNGVLLLDNWYEEQEGSWLSTCGNVYEYFDTEQIDLVLDAVYYGLYDGAYEAYMEYIETTCFLMGAKELVAKGPFSAVTIFLIPLIIALIYACAKLRQKKAKDTTQVTTYVAGGRPVMNVSRDEFVRKHVVTRRIETNNGSSGGNGGGGSHRSSGGVSHGGGGRRR